MKLTKRQLKRIIREEYTRLQRQGLIRESFRDMRHPSQRGQFSLQDYEQMDQEECIQKCLAAIPPNMRKICSMGMGHMVLNDVYHICEPICAKMNCNCDIISDIVHQRLCDGKG